MAADTGSKTYEVGFSTDRFQHIFYISGAEKDDAKSFAHAVFHYYDTPEEWGNKLCITAIAEINFKSCIPDFLHVCLHGKEEIAMPEENEESHKAVRQVIKQMADEGYVPMAIYDEEHRMMTVYATKKLEVDPQTGAASVVLNFSNFGGMLGKAR